MVTKRSLVSLLGLALVAAISGCTTPRQGALSFGANDAPTAKTTAPAAPQPSSPQTSALILSALEAERSGKPEDAIAAYEKVHKSEPQVAIAKNLARLHDRLGHDEIALREYRRAADETGADADFFNDFGYFHSQRGQWTDAERQLRKALTLEPNHRRASCNLGVVLAHQSRDEESLAAFGKAVRPAEAYANVAVIYAKKGDLSRARQLLQRALETEPDLRHAHALLASLDRPTDAMELLPVSAKN